MVTAARYLKILIRLVGVGALLLGLTIWSGHARSWLPVHVSFGITLVLALFATSAIALLAATRRGFAVAVLLSGVLVLVFGRLQIRLLPGPHHWIVALVHLLIGGIAMGLGAALAGAVERKLAEGSS
jgi:hypothetical protein